MFRSARRLLLPLLLAALLPACATVTTGTTSNISVLTEPSGAVCTLSREGEIVGVVNPTPGTVRVSNSSRQLDVRCLRSGYDPGLGAIPAEFQAMTVGNILLGGVIGVVVDAASGAATRYPGTITINLPLQPPPPAVAPPPTRVPASAAPRPARQAPAAAPPAETPPAPPAASSPPAPGAALPTEQTLLQAAATRRSFDTRIAAVRADCPPADRAACEQRARTLEQERDAELLRLDRLRRDAAGA
jgi:hypothetical protein